MTGPRGSRKQPAHCWIVEYLASDGRWYRWQDVAWSLRKSAEGEMKISQCKHLQLRVARYERTTP